MSFIQQEEEARFRNNLREFWASKGITQMKIPQIGGQELDLLKLYKSVCRRGGGQAVSNNKLWKQIVDQFGLPSSCTSASFTLKNHYQRYLLAYQQKYYFGKDDDAELPELVAGRLRKPIKIQDSLSKDPNRIMNQYRMTGQRDNQHEVESSNLAAQLNKIYQKTDKNHIIHFLKRSKMYPLLSEVKRIILGLESGIKSEVTYSLNMLLLYSVNTHTPFNFEQFPNAIQSISKYIDQISAPKSIEELEQLRNLTLVLRNLSLNSTNNLYVIKNSKLFETLEHIFHKNIDKQCSKNILDIMNGLIKINWNPKNILHKIVDFIENDRIDELEISIDLIRTLADYRDESIQALILDNIQNFNKLLLFPSTEIREVVLQIFSNITEMTNQTKLTLAENTKFISRVISFMGSNVRHEKSSAYAAIIIKNLIGYNLTKPFIRLFEGQLAIIASSCENTTNQTAGILAELSLD